VQHCRQEHEFAIDLGAFRPREQFAEPIAAHDVVVEPLPRLGTDKILDLTTMLLSGILMSAIIAHALVTGFSDRARSPARNGSRRRPAKSPPAAPCG
jgi:hypothetical protein